MKLSEKFARQESEDGRLARIGRRRIPKDQAESVRRFLRDPPSLICDQCGRRFSLPMHLGRHKKSKHDRSSAA
jgi:hypothetical protein